MENQTAAPEIAFGRRVREVRTSKGWSQRKLAAAMTRLGAPMTHSQIAKTETGQRPVRLADAVHLAAALGESLEMLLLLDSDPELAAEVDRLEVRRRALEEERAGIDDELDELAEQIDHARAKAMLAALTREVGGD